MLNTKLERYGIRGYNNPNKAKNTCLIKYGTTHYAKTDEYKTSFNKTHINVNSKQAKEKSKNTCLIKYGTTHYAKTDEYRIKRRENTAFIRGEGYNDKLFWESNFLDDNRVLLKGKVQDFYQIKDPHFIVIKALSLGVDCIIPNGNQSSGELEVLDYIKSIVNCEVISGDRLVINPLELDIYIPDKKLAIEFNGIYYHSWNVNKNKNYHKNKTDRCRNNDIHLFHIFEDQWRNKNLIVKSMIKSKLGKLDHRIYARKCEIKEVSSRDSSIFLDKSHLQGRTSTSYRIGLYYEDDLVSLMTFTKKDDNKYILTRFCSKLDTNVIGGFSRLLKHFERLYNPKSLISYANRRWSRGNVYEVNGFEFVNATPPNYFYFHESNGSLLESRIKYQKHKLKDKLSNFDETLTETENMYNNGYRKIYDCGNKLYIKKLYTN
jgi:hypothetical protein